MKNLLIPLLLFGLTVLILRPVPIPDEEQDCLTVKGTVAQIYEAGTMDAVFELEGQDRKFYINRGLEQGLKLEGLRANLIGKEITIKYPNYWTPLDPVNYSRHISKLVADGKTIYTEIE
jgi:hypothetical protein